MTSKQTSDRMKRVRQRDTSAEMIARRWLHSQGVRYRVGGRGLPGSPDLANRTKGWAIFVHGCFWHGHEGCPAGRSPSTNRAFWVNKINANRERDARKVRELQELGFRVFIAWECDLKRSQKSSGRVPKALRSVVRMD
ncbi:MAG: very short patch repair endonuclease [Hyphomonadaceae bacterium]